MFCMTDTPVIAWTISDDFLDHMWLIKSVPDEPDTYTIRNTVAGSYMDLSASKSRLCPHSLCVHHVSNRRRSLSCRLGRGRDADYRVPQDGSRREPEVDHQERDLRYRVLEVSPTSPMQHHDSSQSDDLKGSRTKRPKVSIP